MTDREKTREADEIETLGDETVRVERVEDGETEESPRPPADDAPPRTRSQRRHAAESEGGSKPRESAPHGDRRVGYAAAAVILVLVCTLFVPQVRTVLRQSFTHLPQTSTALAFTTSPTISGATLSVPITVTGTNTGTDTYRVKVWTVNAAGKTDGGTSAQVPMVKGVNATVVKLPVAVDAAVVWVSLDGTDHVIHFKISA